MTAPTPKAAHVWARDPLDFYIEPEWVSDRLFAVERFEGGILDPACGTGRIVRAAERAGLDATGSDIEERAPGFMYAADFLDTDYPAEILIEAAGGICRNVVSNPPFRHAEAFTRKALSLADGKVAMLLPTRWMNSARTGRWLETTPLCRVWLLGPRPSMPPGAAILAGEKPGNGTVDFAWFVWMRGYQGTPRLGWLRRDG